MNKQNIIAGTFILGMLFVFIGALLRFLNVNHANLVLDVALLLMAVSILGLIGFIVSTFSKKA